MDNREYWLNTLSDEELLALSPWDIVTTENARKFLTSAGRAVLRRYSWLGLSKMSGEEILHEVYPTLVESLPGILNTCVKRSAPENRDRFIFGCLSRLIRYRLSELVFGASCPSERFYIEELGEKCMGDNSSPSMLPSAHSLMHPYMDEINLYIESQPSYHPQFLSESEFVADKNIQDKHALIEQFRSFLTSREVDILRSMLLNSDDRSLVALEVGTTPKQVSRYRQSIQRKMRTILKDLGWEDEEISTLTGKKPKTTSDARTA